MFRITVYHRTTAENAKKIYETGIMAAKEDAAYFGSKDTGYASDYGDTVVKLKIPSTVLQVNDIFDGEVHFDIPLKYKSGGFSLDVSDYLEKANESKENSSENENITETKAFKDWFGNSKAVNKDGTPKVFYHGTDGDFNTFKYISGETGKNGLWHGYGFYFTDQSPYRCGRGFVMLL